MKPPANPRLAALEILVRIDTGHANSSALLPSYEEHLPERDRGLLHQLVMGCLRKRLYLDALLGQFLLKGLNKLDNEVLNALRLGAYQIIFLDRIPDSAAVNESVKLVQKAGKTSAKGLVNAVLRKIAGGAREVDTPDRLDRLSIENSHPTWLLERWERQFGPETTSQICAANNTVPRVGFRLTGRSDKVALQRLNASETSFKRSAILETAFSAEKSFSVLRQLSDEGLIYFQDEGSQLVGSVITLPKPGKILDACSAPGGKTSLIAAKHPESLVVAGDKYPHRLARVNLLSDLFGLSNMPAFVYDAEHAMPFNDEVFDAVLVDAPCSGTGTLRSNPEIRYRLTEDDIKELSLKQSVILDNAAATLKTGGCLVYSTCSLERDENEEVIAGFLAGHAGYSVLSPDVPERFRTEDGFARIFPHDEGTDGFFIAILRKNSK